MDSLAGCSRWRVGVLVKDIEERRLQARYHFDRCFWEHQNSWKFQQVLLGDGGYINYESTERGCRAFEVKIDISTLRAVNRHFEWSFGEEEWAGREDACLFDS